MNKEKVSYVRHILTSDFVQLDIFNALLAFSIIIVCFIAFVGGETEMFGSAFILGAVLAFFNALKSFMRKAWLTAAVFGVLIPVLGTVAFLISKYLPS